MRSDRDVLRGWRQRWTGWLANKSTSSGVGWDDAMAVYVSSAAVASVFLRGNMSGESQTDGGVVHMKADPIASQSAIMATLRAHRRSLGAPEGQAVELVLSPELYSSSLIPKPDLGSDELVDAVRWLVQEQLEYPVDDAVIDAFEVPSTSREAASVFVITMPKPKLTELLESVHQAGFTVNSVDVTELAVRNLVWQCFPLPDQSVALLRLTGNSGLITISRSDELYVARRVSGVPETFNEAAFGEFKDRLLQLSLIHI